jgi:hypothetical protein
MKTTGCVLVAWEEKAIKNAGLLPKKELDKYKKRLELFKAGKPFREEKEEPKM